MPVSLSRAPCPPRASASRPSPKWGGVFCGILQQFPVHKAPASGRNSLQFLPPKPVRVAGVETAAIHAACGLAGCGRC